MTSQSILCPRAALAAIIVAGAATACGSTGEPGAPSTANPAELSNATVTTAPSPPPPGNENGNRNGAATPGPTAPTLLSPERQVVAKLGLGAHFLIGLGNDSSGSDANQTQTYGLGQKLDIHYLYLSGVSWPEWNAPAGNYITLQANAAKAHGIVPMFTLYQAAAYGEDNLGAFNTTDFMTKYWRGVRIMFEKLGAFDSPAIVHVEPDLWGYTQAKSEQPSGVPMKVGSLVPECTDLPPDVSGMAKCVIRLSRSLAPKVVIGLSVSSFGAFTNGQSDPLRIAAYMNKIGANQADITVLETLDRDAGCFENGSDANCKRGGSFYWDESNVAHPNFHDHLAWAKTIRDVVARPLLWWQMPLGVPANTAGYAGHYRDNRVRYLFAHPSQFAAVGGIGAVFGTGVGNQTSAQTDGGQFKAAVTGYYTSPAALQ